MFCSRQGKFIPGGEGWCAAAPDLFPGRLFLDPEPVCQESANLFFNGFANFLERFLFFYLKNGL